MQTVLTGQACMSPFFLQFSGKYFSVKGKDEDYYFIKISNFVNTVKSLQKLSQ